MMNKSGPNMSAALAISIERQVDGIIAAARARCALLAHLSDAHSIAELDMDDEAKLIRDRAESMRAFSRWEADLWLLPKPATTPIRARRGLGGISGSIAKSDVATPPASTKRLGRLDIRAPLGSVLRALLRR